MSHSAPEDTTSALTVLTNRERLDALKRHRVIGTSQKHLDRLPRLASRLYEAPIALLTLLGDEKQRFISAVGTDLDGVPARPSVCRYTVATGRPLVVEDLSEDDRFADEYYVTGDLHLRFYAGAPMETSDGHRIGTLCVYDVEPRSPAPGLKTHLQDLADMAIEALERDQFSLGDEPYLSQTVLDHLPGIFYVTDTDGRLRRWNARFASVAGYDDEELDGRPGPSFFPESERPRIRSAVETVFESGSVTVEAPFLTKDGETIPMILTGVRMEVHGKARLVGMGVDISERKQRERQLQEAKDAAEAAREEAERARQRAEKASRSKSQFLRGVAHDLKTPITAIEMSATVLAETLDDDEADRARRIGLQAGRVDKMIDQLVKLAELEEGEMELATEPVAPAPVAEQVVAGLEERARREGIELRVRSGSQRSPIEMHAHESSLHRVLQNLVENALDYCERGDEVTVRVAPEHGGAVITVEDTGPGIATKDQRDLFKPFARGEEEGTGAGLGLAITNELVEAMGGTVGVQSEPGEGTTFSVRLPRADAPE